MINLSLKRIKKSHGFKFSLEEKHKSPFAVTQSLKKEIKATLCIFAEAEALERSAYQINQMNRLPNIFLQSKIVEIQTLPTYLNQRQNIACTEIVQQ